MDESIILNVQTLNIIDNVIDTITGYGSERKTNFTINLSENKKDGSIKIRLTYNDSGKIVFEGVFNQHALVEAVKSEDEREEEKRRKRNKDD